ncbi:MAG TPA: peptidoglycan-binding protein, partial [Nevskiaceae bacterium]
TDEDKLLRIMLIGQPELIDLLARPDLRQLASRITARYHLPPLTGAETHGYIVHRLRVAGARQPLFTAGAMAAVYQRSHGVPRLVNILCDRALLGAYAKGAHQVTEEIVHRAAAEVLGAPPSRSQAGRSFRPKAHRRWGWVEIALVATVLVVAGLLAQQLLDHFGDRIPALSSAIAALPPASHSADDASAATARVAAGPAGADAARAVKVAADGNGRSATSRAGVPAAPAAAPTDLGQVMAHPESLNAIVARLIALWSPDLRIDRGTVVCSALSTAGLQCYHGNGDLADLGRMNRPAILHLAAGQDHSQYVLLRQLSGTTATLDTTRGLVALPVDELKPAWTGEFLLVWPGNIATPLLSVGTRGNGVVWLRRQLALLDGDPAPDSPSPIFDNALREQVMDYQRAAGLDVDGVAGIMTLVSLSSVGGADDTPTLHAVVGDRS